MVIVIELDSASLTAGALAGADDTRSCYGPCTLVTL